MIQLDIYRFMQNPRKMYAACALRKTGWKSIQQKRPGAVLIAVFACLVISLSLVFTSLGLSIRSQRESKSVGMIYQTAFLLDAGAERAIDQLRKSSDYQGETWKPAFAYVADLSQQNGTQPNPSQPNPSQSNNDCTIEIRITRNDPTGTKENVTVDVIARIEPSEFSLYPVQQSRQFEYKFPKN